MAVPVVKVESLSKKFVLTHEAQERYTTLRDVITHRVKKMTGRLNGHVATKEEFWALQNISFEVEQGDRVGIIGRNGAGKSTLLKVLSRITDPTAGRISIKGRVASLLEVGTGFHPELTGRENIYLNGAILGMSRAEIRKKFDEIVAFAEVEKFLDTPVKRYSSGMYVRLAFAVAAHLEPEILIVDEVLAVGDAQFQKKCLGKMEDVSKNEGRTVLFVSHNMGVISQLCNKAVLLEYGHVKKIGTVNEVVTAYLSNNDKADGYYPNPAKLVNKTNYFKSIVVTDSEGQVVSDFAFNEQIRLNFQFIIQENTSGLQIGIALQDKYNSRVFTVLKEVDSFKKDDQNVFHGCVVLPGSLIAPNIYSFVCALWTRDGRVYDLVDGNLSVKIHDTGTDLSQYEGADYGSIIIKPEWL